ncbi:hypothetical protein [Thermasporomyces composti]|jgi:hypothetical protein|uniref:Uncharacterized protein n=1 Tax=Thermasporomyces composti TaxID=696763 RepID=A0A3D9VCU4_THECX|nr:hypothetical protein [Thermasporomyces composti]REF36905.1 hypothetical protein DFJ64_2340 [Thermasporomyces composti]
MSIWSRLLQRLRDRAVARKLGEQDAPADMGTARTRATGGVAGSENATTTGTGPSEMFVGRVAGDESDAGETGAERRATAARQRADEHASPPGSQAARGADDTPEA